MTKALTDYKVLTFDCYGTMIDWESGIWDAFQPLLMANGRSDVTRLIGPAVAPPGKLATIAAALATLLDNGADLPRPLASRDPVQDHMTNRNFTLQRLAACLMVNIKSHTPQALPIHFLCAVALECLRRKRDK